MPLRGGGSARDLHTAEATTRGRERSRPPHGGSHYAGAGVLAIAAQGRLSLPRSFLATSGKAALVGIGSHFPPPLRGIRRVPSARTSRPRSVASAVFRPLALPAPAPWHGVGCPVFHVEQFTFVKCYFTFVKCNFTIVK